jgi:tetratricopeptide (TPR) repeat protein
LNNITNIGIYLYNTSPGLFYNTIQGSSGSYGYNGIRCEEYSSPYIAHNTIRYFTTGVCNYRYSSPIFSEYGFSEGHNKIVRTSTAIYGWYYSSPRVGQNGYPWGYNYIDSASTYNVEAAWYTNIMAENNWWGTASPPSNKFNAVSNSSVDYTPYLTSPPSLSIIKSDPYSSAAMPIALKKTNGTAHIVSGDLSSNSLFDDEDIKVALRYEFEQEYQSAFDIYEKVFKKELNTAKGRYALIRLGDCFFKLNRNGIDKYLAGISESYKSLKKDELTVIALDLVNRELLTNREYEKVADNMKKIKNEFSINSEIEKSALYGLISLYVNCLGDIKTASSYYEELKQKYPEDELLIGSEILLYKQYKASLEKMVNDNEINNREEVLLTTDNYPNPFNPTTVIRYQLPEKNYITLKVYDILGKEVATLVNEYKDAGSYKVELSADKYQLSSGIYFYTLKAGKNYVIKKMMLAK